MYFRQVKKTQEDVVYFLYSFLYSNLKQLYFNYLLYLNIKLKKKTFYLKKVSQILSQK